MEFPFGGGGTESEGGRGGGTGGVEAVLFTILVPSGRVNWRKPAQGWLQTQYDSLEFLEPSEY